MTISALVVDDEPVARRAIVRALTLAARGTP